MKNIYEVLQHKEADLERLKRELQALRVAAALLDEELAPEVQVAPSPVWTYSTPPAQPANGGPVATATKNPSGHGGQGVASPEKAHKFPPPSGGSTVPVAEGTVCP